MHAGDFRISGTQSQQPKRPVQLKLKRAHTTAFSSRVGSFGGCRQKRLRSLAGLYSSIGMLPAGRLGRFFLGGCGFGGRHFGGCFAFSSIGGRGGAARGFGRGGIGAHFGACGGGRGGRGRSGFGSFGGNWLNRHGGAGRPGLFAAGLAVEAALAGSNGVVGHHVAAAAHHHRGAGGHRNALADAGTGGRGSSAGHAFIGASGGRSSGSSGRGSSGGFGRRGGGRTRAFRCFGASCRRRRGVLGRLFGGPFFRGIPGIGGVPTALRGSGGGYASEEKQKK